MTKFDPRVVKCVFLGYSQTKKGYKCYDTITKKLYVSRDVRFLETWPFFYTPDQGEMLKDLFPLSNVEPCYKHSIDVVIEHNTSAQGSTNNSSTTCATDDCFDIDDISQGNTSAMESNAQDHIPRRNPPRGCHPSIKLQDYVVDTVRYPLTKS